LPYTSIDDAAIFQGTLACYVDRPIFRAIPDARGEKHNSPKRRKDFLSVVFSLKSRLHVRDAECNQERDSAYAGEKHFIGF